MNWDEISERLRHNPDDAEAGSDEEQGNNRHLSTRITSLHLMDIGEFPLLTHEAEIELAKQIELGRQAADQLMTTSDPIERARLKKEIEEGAKARHMLWVSNCRLVVRVASRYIQNIVPLDDLIQEGNLGLEVAINRFDWRRDYNFSTYAARLIRWRILKAITDEFISILITFRVNEIICDVFKVSEEIIHQNGTEPDITQISEYLNIPVGVVKEIMKVYQYPVNINLTFGSYEGMIFSDFMPGTGNAEGTYEQIVMSHIVRKEMLSKLDDREVKIINLRFGLSDGKPHTLLETGLELKMSRERVRQIQKKALKKLWTLSMSR